MPVVFELKKHRLDRRRTPKATGFDLNKKSTAVLTDCKADNVSCGQHLMKRLIHTFTFIKHRTALLLQKTKLQSTKLGIAHLLNKQDAKILSVTSLVEVVRQKAQYSDEI